MPRGELWRVSDGLSTPGFSEMLSLRLLHISFQDPATTIVPPASIKWGVLSNTREQTVLEIRDSKT